MKQQNESCGAAEKKSLPKSPTPKVLPSKKESKLTITNIYSEPATLTLLQAFAGAPVMKPGFRDLSGKTNFLIVTGLILLLLSLVIDYVADVMYAGADLFRTAPDVALHVVLFAIQLAIVLACYVLFQKHRKMEELLEAAMVASREEKAKSEAIIAAIGDGICIVDNNFKIIYQNRIHTEIVGGDYAGRYCYQAYHGREEVCDECPVARSFEDGLIHKNESQMGNDLSHSNVEITASPLRNSAGVIIAGIEVVRDISKRKTAEKKLQKRTAAIEASMDGIAIFNDEEGYVYMNRAHAEVYGHESPEPLLGKSWRIFYDESEIQRFETGIIAKLFETGQWRGEAVGKRKDGTTFPQELSLALLDDGGIICVVRDVTDRKETEEAVKKLNQDLSARASTLTAANRELESFSYSLSHDLRTPLTQIYSATQALQEVFPDKLDETGKFLLSTIAKASEHIEELIEAMLVLSRVTQSGIHREETDLSAMAQGIAVELQMSDPQRRVEFTIASGLVVSGDAKLLRVALRNLLENAWKYTSTVPQPHIEVGVMPMERKTFFIRDNGIGFDMKDCDKLFKPFKRLPGTQQFSGTGIGLATVQRVVNRHGGEIWGEGTPGKGAVFFFTLAENDVSDKAK